MRRRCNLWPALTGALARQLSRKQPGLIHPPVPLFALASTRLKASASGPWQELLGFWLSRLPARPGSDASATSVAVIIAQRGPHASDSHGCPGREPLASHCRSCLSHLSARLCQSCLSQTLSQLSVTSQLCHRLCRQAGLWRSNVSSNLTTPNLPGGEHTNH